MFLGGVNRNVDYRPNNTLRTEETETGQTDQDTAAHALTKTEELRFTICKPYRRDQWQPETLMTTEARNRLIV